MGKERIQSLLNQLKDNHERDIRTSAAIFSVAQVAVNQLGEVIESAEVVDLPALPPSPLTKAQLLARYQSYAGCRKAAKALGVKFHKTLSWDKLICAFSYVESLEKLKQEYLKTYPNQVLSGITVELEL